MPNENKVKCDQRFAIRVTTGLARLCRHLTLVHDKPDLTEYISSNISFTFGDGHFGFSSTILAFRSELARTGCLIIIIQE